MLRALLLLGASLLLVVDATTCDDYSDEHVGICSYAGKGYDAVGGDPHADQADPGWRSTIFDDDWKQTAVSVTPTNVCSYNAESTAMHGEKSAQEALKSSWSTDDGATVLFANFEFTASDTVSSVTQEVSAHSSSVFESVALCQLYTVELPPPFVEYTFTSYFEACVAQLPTNASTLDDRAKIYDTLFKYYGTHYAAKHYMGGQMILRQTMTSDSYSTYSQTCEDNSWGVEAGASGWFNIWSVHGSYSSEDADEVTQAYDQAMSSGTTQELYKGGALVHGDPSAWYDSLKTTMTALPASESGALVAVSELLTSLNFPDDPNIDAKKAAAETALDELCGAYDGCIASPFDPFAIPDITIAASSVRLWSVAWRPDQSAVVAADDDGYVILYDVITGKPLVYMLDNQTKAVDSVAFSPDGAYVASGGWAPLKIWDATTGACLRTLDDGATSVVFSPDGAYIASGSGNTVKIWDATNGSCLRTLTTSGVMGVAFSPDGAYLASGSFDTSDNVKIWDATTGSCLRTLTGHTDHVYEVAFSPDGVYVASGSADTSVKIWDATTGSCLRTLTDHTSYVQSVAFSPDGAYVASGSWDTTVKIWDATTGSCLRTLTGHTDAVKSVAFSPDGVYIASGSYDGTVMISAVGIAVGGMAENATMNATHS